MHRLIKIALLITAVAALGIFAASASASITVPGNITVDATDSTGTTLTWQVTINPDTYVDPEVSTNLLATCLVSDNGSFWNDFAGENIGSPRAAGARLPATPPDSA